MAQELTTLPKGATEVPSRFLPARDGPIPRSSHIVRIFAFLLLEAGFIILGTWCLFHPIVLFQTNDNVALKEAKAIMTVIAVIWHSLATLVAKDVVLYIFSAECVEQYRQHQKLIPETTDRVSTATSGVLAQIKHFASRSATTHYRVAFPALLLLMAIGAIGPAVITINSIPTGEPGMIQLSSLTLVEMFTFMNSSFATAGPRSQENASDRANLVLRMEVAENYTFGYQTSDLQLLIPNIITRQSA